MTWARNRRKARRRAPPKPPRPPDAPELEEAFQSWVTETAERLGWDWWHDNYSRRNKEGWPDLVLAHDGYPGGVIFAELKTQTGRVSKKQHWWLERLRTRNEVYVWRPADRPTILAVLDFRHTGIRLS